MPLAQVALEVDPLDRLVGHGRFEQGVARRRVRLGANQRDLGLAEHLVGCRSAGPPERDADRRADEPLARADRERCPKLRPDPLGDRVRLVGIRHLVEDDPELVAAEAGDGVARPQAGDQALPNVHQQSIARGVADALVDDLEAIEVEQDDADLARALGPRGGEGMGDPVGQELAIGQAGRRVVEGAALGGVDEPGVVEGDRGELREARQRLDLALAPAPLDLARGQAKHADHTPRRHQGNPDDGPDRPDGDARRAAAPAVVVVHGHRGRRPEDLAGEPFGDRHPVPDELGEEAGAVADDELVLTWFDQVDVAVRRSDERGRPGHDRLDEDRWIVPVEQRQGRLAQCPQVRIGAVDSWPVPARSTGLVMYRARSATPTSSSLVRPSSG